MSSWLRWSWVVVLVVGCSASDTVSSTTPPPECVSAKEEALVQLSVMEISVEPNPVTAQATATLTVSDPDLDEDTTSIGVDALWQCWDGAEWITTHIVYRGFGDSRGETIAVNPNFQIRAPDIQLWVHRGYSIAIPQVEPGIYRIVDEISVEDEQVPGFVLVEVTAP